MLSTILKELRAQKKVTQEDMANLLNIKRQTYSAYERGVSFPDIIALTKIAEFFEVSTDYLLGINKVTVENQNITDKTQSLIESLSKEELRKVIEYIDFLKSKHK